MENISREMRAAARENVAAMSASEAMRVARRARMAREANHWVNWGAVARAVGVAAMERVGNVN